MFKKIINILVICFLFSSVISANTPGEEQSINKLIKQRDYISTMLHILGAKGFVKIDVDKEKGLQVPLFNFNELKEWIKDKNLVRYMPAMAFLMFATGGAVLYLAENPEEIAAFGEEIGSKSLVKRAPVIAEKII